MLNDAMLLERAFEYGEKERKGLAAGEALSLSEAEAAVRVAQREAEEYAEVVERLAGFDAHQEDFANFSVLRFELACVSAISSRDRLLSIEIAVAAAISRNEDRNDLGLDGGQSLRRLLSAWERFAATIAVADRQFDDPDRLDHLAAGANVKFLAERRAELGGRFRDDPPWWLDGRIEDSIRNAALAAAELN